MVDINGRRTLLRYSRLGLNRETFAMREKKSQHRIRYSANVSFLVALGPIESLVFYDSGNERRKHHIVLFVLISSFGGTRPSLYLFVAHTLNT